jgi:hypothetical protein
VDTAPANPHPGPDGTLPQAPVGPGSLPGDADRDGEVDVLYLAGQRPAPPGEWLLITAVDGAPGAEFLARVLPPDGRQAHGGDVLAHLGAEPAQDLDPLMVRVSVWTVLGGRLVPVAAWDRHDPEGWPEQIRPTAAFAMGMLTELEEQGADLGARHRVHLDEAAVTATAGIPLGTTAPTAPSAGPPGR